MLNPSQVAFLGIGRIQALPRIVEGDMKSVPVVHFTLTMDHRAIGGAPAAAFLKELEGIFVNLKGYRDMQVSSDVYVLVN